MFVIIILILKNMFPASNVAEKRQEEHKGSSDVRRRVGVYWVRQRQCLLSADGGASCRNGVKEERTVRPQRGCWTRKLFTMLFWTSSSADVNRRLRKTAS